jgi:predicted O-methyltransferase YrrM
MRTIHTRPREQRGPHTGYPSSAWYYRLVMKKRRGRMIVDYDHGLLPNPHLRMLESTDATGGSPGFPSWNLLYYSLLCSLPWRGEPATIVESGTNFGCSTIVLAQALRDSRRQGTVLSVDHDGDMTAIAKKNCELAGLADLVKLSTGSSLPFLERVAASHQIVFAFLDGPHDCASVVGEFAAIHSNLVANQGTVYFDNTSSGGVAKALRIIRDRYAGNLCRFDNCSWAPRGNCIWQPD